MVGSSGCYTPLDMTAPTTPTDLSASFFDERIKVLEEREDELKEQLAKVSQELAWFREGRALFGEGPKDDGTASETGGKTTELVPSTEVLQSKGTKPTLRQAILRSLLDREADSRGRELQWQVPMVISELKARGWLPGGKNGENMVRHMLGDMVKRGQLVRPAYGKYALAPAMRRAELSAGGDE